MPLPIITTLSDVTTTQMLERLEDRSVHHRQVEISRRVDIVEGDWKDQGLTSLRRLYRTPAIAEEVAKFWKPSPNIATALLGIVAVAYEHPPIRVLKDASLEAQAAWASAMKESNIRTKARMWERMAWAANVVITVPIVRRGNRGPELQYETFLPHHTEVFVDPRDPMGGPKAILASYQDIGDNFFDQPTRFVVVDDKAWHYYDGEGRITKESVPHGAGIFPGTVWRLRDPVDDFWSTMYGAGVFDVTIECANIHARMDWVRFGQDRKKETLASKRLDQIARQAFKANGPFEVRMDPADFRYEVHDLNTPVDSFVGHIVQHAREAARLWDIPPDMIDFRPGAEALDPSVNAQQHHQVARIRDRSIEWFRRSEEDNAWKTALVMRGMRHPLSKLVPPEAVADRFEVNYPKFTFVEHPKVKVEVLEGERDLGVKSTFDCYQELNPGSTPAEARKEVLRVAEEEAELEKIYIEHNLPRRGHDRRQNIAELQGALGGMQGGVARKEKKDDAGRDIKPSRTSSSSPPSGPST